RIPYRVATSGARDQRTVRRRTIRECIVGQDLLAKDRVNRRSFFRHRENLKTALTENLPRSCVINHLRVIAQQDGDRWPLLLVVDLLDQGHSALGTVPWLVESAVVSRASAIRTDIDFFRLIRGSLGRNRDDSDRAGTQHHQCFHLAFPFILTRRQRRRFVLEMLPLFADNSRSPCPMLAPVGSTRSEAKPPL